MLTGGPNYIMIRRAIFGKVHGHRVKEIWPISQFPAKHTGVVSGAKIVFARPGLARLLGCGNGLINNEFIICIACSPQRDCISLLRDPSVTCRIHARMRKKIKKKKTFCLKSGETFNSVKKTELDWGCSFQFRSSVQFLVLLKIASSPTDHSMSYFSDLLFSNDGTIR